MTEPQQVNEAQADESAALRRQMAELETLEAEIRGAYLMSDSPSQDRIRTLFQALLQVSPDGIVIVNQYGKIILVNAQSEAIFGFTQAELMDWSIEELIPSRFRSGHETYRTNYLEDPRPRLMGTGLALYAQAKDGREIPVEVSLKPIQFGEYDYVIAAVRDVTELRQAEVTLQQVVAELIDTNAHLEQFAHAASHDLREPLRGLNHYLQLLESRHKSQLDQQAGYYLERALANAARLATLVDDLSAYAKLHHREPQTQQANLMAVLKGVLGKLESIITLNDAKITFDQLPTMTLNPIQMASLFEHLIRNAIKFRREIAPEIHVGVEPLGEDWLFSVEDNGLGIETQYLERIFQAFQRLHTRQDYAGNGLGLTICRRIVENHGGRMWAESEFGRGATFYFSLPTIRVDEVTPLFTP